MIAPYYNKPPQEGLFRHFETVAQKSTSLILYNIPGRTRQHGTRHHRPSGQVDNIVGVKEASAA